MFALFTSIRNRTSAHNRSVKTPGELYRILCAEFERLKGGAECSCRMPMLFESHRKTPDAPNWKVEPLWHGCVRCQQLVQRVYETNEVLYDVRALPADEPAPRQKAVQRPGLDPV